MVRRNLKTVSDDRLRLGTGHDSEYWFDLLDAAGATQWRHSKIAGFLEDRDLRVWWSEAIATAYERERGLWSESGNVTATATKLIPADLSEVWHFISDDDEREAWIGEEWPINAVREGRFVRLDCGDGTDVTLRLADADGKVRVIAQHAHLGGEDRRDATAKLWEAALDRLAEVVDWA